MSQNPLLRNVDNLAEREHEIGREAAQKEAVKEELSCFGAVGCAFLCVTFGLGTLVWLFSFLSGR